MPRNGKRNVLITGATGVIGRQLAEQLYHDDPRVRHIMAVALDPRRPYYFEEYDSKRFSYHSLNILRSRDLTNLLLSPRFREAEIDTVVHLAYMDRLSHPPRERHVLNVDGTRALLARCAELGTIKKFIFLSSWSVYKLKPHNSVLLDTSSELNFDAGANSWIKDRVDTDMLCRTEMERGGMQVLVLRPSGIIGRNVCSQINEYLTSAVCPMVAGFNPMVNLVHMMDVIRALRCGIHRSVRGVFNLVGQDTAPLADFVRLAGRPRVTLPEAGVRAFNRMQRRVGLSRYDFSVQPELIKFPCVPDGNGASEALGYRPTHHVRF